jgi:signal transduction histidine kinase
MNDPASSVSFTRERIDELLACLEAMVARDEGQQVPISRARDELDAIAYGINALADELRWANARVTDIERRLAADLRISRDAAERANASKTLFLRTASHEIRTPIAAILGITDLLAMGTSPEEMQDLVERLRTNSRALLTLVGNVLDLSRLEADKLALSREPFSPLELVDEIVDSLAPEARKKDIDVRVDFGVLATLVIESDRSRLRQIVVNLVANALRFTMAGTIDILARPTVDAKRFMIDVTDTGIGIATHHLPSLFEPFGQLDHSAAGANGGFGLGLALSRRLAEQLGGTLCLVQSEPGKGSTFRLTLDMRPVDRRAADDAAPDTAAHDHGAPLLLDGCRVLLAEDHPDLHLAIARSLRLEGASVSHAYNGREAVAMVEANPFDVVLMDVKMPQMDGLTATQTLRSAGYQMPIVAITADSSAETRAASVAAGCNAYLTKPFEPGELIASIKFLRNSRSEAVRQ